MKNHRIGWLDLWRSTAVVLMLAYHFIFDLTEFGQLDADLLDTPGMEALRLFVCTSFILIAGISSRLSGNNFKRGALVLAAGLLVSIVSALAGYPVYFGILQLLGVSILLYGLLGRYFQRAGPLLAVFSLALFFIAYPCEGGVEVGANGLWMFGFVPENFYSADYYPLLPWFFLFLFGTWLGGFVEKRQNAKPGPAVPAFLAWPGRHSLLIYLLHQPLLYGLCWLLFH